MDTPWTKLHSLQSVFVVVWFVFLLHPGYSKQEPCDTCRYLVSNFKKGLEKTAGQNFGGGNTAWEEEKLTKYETSETRLLEVMESVCGTSNFECNRMLEQSEELLETWWFKKQTQYPDLFQWLCIDTLKVCCPPGTFGSDCLSCSGGSEKPCNGNGRCDGDGTRSGTGLCNCSPSYGGPLCTECSIGYYEASRNETHLVCSECYKTCSKCTGPEDDNCMLCKKGWMLHDHKCIDIDECGLEKAQCRANQFCVNLEGSYECRDCDKACVGCMGSGPARCKKCNKGYRRDGVKCLDIDECNNQDPICTGEHEVCVNTEGSHRCTCEKGYSKNDGVCTQDQQDPMAEKGLFEDMTDDELVVLQQMFFGIIICALATLAAKGDMVFTAIFIGAIAAMAGYWLTERGDRVLDGFMKGR
ncbi:protein disulfide isomerase CRELD1 [Microcaecilia unicolor]|uniref:Cysteine-rich with EGF-like domain protein 1 n=1 Tax=Microcaecilia unicolor TaxID=1415580 RepID=A0A6P7YHW7_9AMPH|nr:cysteine-rich with EGF-like domain protein 1 [Microcaecilia unicolor]